MASICFLPYGCYKNYVAISSDKNWTYINKGRWQSERVMNSENTYMVNLLNKREKLIGELKNDYLGFLRLQEDGNEIIFRKGLWPF